jgi:hypothetical protein
MQLATTHFQNKNLTICLMVSLVVLSLWVLNGCTAKYGRLQGSNDVTTLFETQQILPDHTYYYNGFQAIPYVIVGIGDRKAHGL